VVDALDSREGDFVVLLNVPQGTKERITMTRDHHVSRSTWERCGWDVAYRLSEDTLTVTFQHHDR
jgi:hypothetical protein